MEKQQSIEGGEGEAQREHEHHWPAPRIYVASLSDYNAGQLHGAWLNAAQEPEQLDEAVQTMLAASPEPSAEEFAIHDYENFGPLHLSEFENLSMVSSIANGIAEYGPAFAHWAAIVGTEDAESLRLFEETYMGHFNSLKEYGEDLIDSFGLRQELEENIPQLLNGYVHIDVAGFVRDVQLSGQITASEGDGGVYVFENH